MFVISHIFVALLSVGYTFYTYFSPTKTKLQVSSALIAMTLVSGTVLVISLKTHLVRACMTGLVFIGFSLAGVIAAKHKLTVVSEKAKNEL